MGNNQSVAINKDAIRFDYSNQMYYYNHFIGINELNEKALSNIEIKINKLNSSFVNKPQHMLKILNVLKNYIETNTPYNLGQIDAFNFTFLGKPKFQVVNTSAKQNQSNWGVPTNKFYYKVCELSLIE